MNSTGIFFFFSCNFFLKSGLKRFQVSGFFKGRGKRSGEKGNFSVKSKHLSLTDLKGQQRC